MQLSATSASASASAPDVHRTVGDMIRGAGSGYAEATRQGGVEVDKAAIHPFETVSTVTGFIKDKTSGIKGVGRATSLLHTVAGFGMLIGASTVAGAVRAPGQAASSAAHRVADLIDGGRTSAEFGREPSGELQVSAVGQALAGLGMR